MTTRFMRNSRTRSRSVTLAAAGGGLIAASGLVVMALGSGGSALADSGPATLCSAPTSCVTGDPVLASVDVQSATAATLSGTAMTFGSATGVLPGNTVTGTETYQVGTNDAKGAYVTATWDDSEITANNVSSLVPVGPITGGFTTGFGVDDLITTNSAFYNQGMVNLSTLKCDGATSACQQDTDIPWSNISVTPDASAGGTAATFAFDATGGVDPDDNGGTISTNNVSGTNGTGGGSTIDTVAVLAGPTEQESLTDTYSLVVPASQEAGIYAADLWYQVVSN